LRDLGILAGTDGPHHNVLKLRPPLIFSASDAARFTSTLFSILAEAPAQTGLAALSRELQFNRCSSSAKRCHPEAIPMKIAEGPQSWNHAECCG